MLDATRERETKRDAGAGDGEGTRLVCAACGHAVARTSARREVSGAHEHTFVNPHGHVFHIGCFSPVTGATAIGVPSHQFSWFPGYTWRVALCVGCGVHLGWRFGNGGGFWGLIVDRLSEDTSE